MTCKHDFCDCPHCLQADTFRRQLKYLWIITLANATALGVEFPMLLNR